MALGYAGVALAVLALI
ncbi:hypothetical protein [Escherichia coli]